MKCKAIEPLIYLYKPGELTENEKDLLEEHFKVCGECKKLRQNLINQNSVLSVLTNERFSSVQSSFDKELIFAKINFLENEKPRNVLERIKYAGFYYFSLPAYRYASAVLIAGFVITFLMQNYLAYMNISQLERKFGNPSNYEAAEEIKPIVLGIEDFSFISQSSRKINKTEKKTVEFRGFKGTKMLLLSMRKHRYFQTLANHNPGIDPAYLIGIYNKSVYLGESKRNQN